MRHVWYTSSGSTYPDGEIYTVKAVQSEGDIFVTGLTMSTVKGDVSEMKDHYKYDKDYYTYDKDKEEKPKKQGIFSKIDKWKLVKQVVAMAASGCATMVISRYLKANMPESENVFEKAAMGVGMYCITGIVGTKVAEYTEQELDGWRESITKNPLLEEGEGDDGTD